MKPNRNYYRRELLHEDFCELGFENFSDDFLSEYGACESVIQERMEPILKKSYTLIKTMDWYD